MEAITCLLSCMMSLYAMIMLHLVFTNHLLLSALPTYCGGQLRSEPTSVQVPLSTSDGPSRTSETHFQSNEDLPLIAIEARSAILVIPF